VIRRAGRVAHSYPADAGAPTAADVGACSPNALVAAPTMVPAMASDDVAAGDGALRTWMMFLEFKIEKSSSSAPSEAMAWARTPDGPK
jgi:hypothetical protein